MTLCMDESKLIVGTSDGLLYVYSNLSKKVYFIILDGEEKLKVIDIHKNKGFITNIVPISKDLWMFGLDSDCYTSYKNFKVLSKELKNQDTHFTTKFLFPTEKINLHKFTEGNSIKIHWFKYRSQRFNLSIHKIFRKNSISNRRGLLE